MFRLYKQKHMVRWYGKCVQNVLSNVVRDPFSTDHTVPDIRSQAGPELAQNSLYASSTSARVYSYKTCENNIDELHCYKT